jgi:hypothetical protein
MVNNSHIVIPISNRSECVVHLFLEPDAEMVDLSPNQIAVIQLKNYDVNQPMSIEFCRDNWVILHSSGEASLDLR